MNKDQNGQTKTQPFTLSNFRPFDTIQDWPLGSNKRGNCVFEHETHKTRGQRIVRTTTGKGKASIYYLRVCLVDGSDGKTHYLGATGYGHLAVMSCDMLHSDFCVFERDENYREYLAALYACTESWTMVETLVDDSKGGGL